MYPPVALVESLLAPAGSTVTVVCLFGADGLGRGKSGIIYTTILNDVNKNYKSSILLIEHELNNHDTIVPQ